MNNKEIEQDIKKTKSAKFLEALEGEQWITTEAIIEKLDLIPGFWANVFALESMHKMLKKTFVRREIKQLKNDDGMPIFASIETVSSEGETLRVYKHENSFAPEDFRKAAEFYSNLGIGHLRKAAHYAEGYKLSTGKQMKLPFNPETFAD